MTWAQLIVLLSKSLVDKLGQLTYMMMRSAYQIGFCAKPLVLMQQDKAGYETSAGAEYNLLTT